MTTEDLIDLCKKLNLLELIVPNANKIWFTTAKPLPDRLPEAINVNCTDNLAAYYPNSALFPVFQIKIDYENDLMQFLHKHLPDNQFSLTDPQIIGF